MQHSTTFESFIRKKKLLVKKRDEKKPSVRMRVKFEFLLIRRD